MNPHVKGLIYLKLFVHVLFPQPTLGVYQLNQIHVITRHGSRYPLEKDADTLAEATPGTLTPRGQKQHYDLGVYIKEKFSQDTDMFDLYNPNQVTLESSYYDRTIVSANSLALGLFNQTARDPHNESMLPYIPANIPVFSTSSDLDVVIRAYDKCNTFLDKLDELYVSDEWLNLQKQHEPLLTSLAKVKQFQEYVDSTTGSIPLTQLWNVYDLIFVAKTECPTNTYSATCLSLPYPQLRDTLSSDDWNELEALAQRTELMKYSQETAGHLLGSNLLMEIDDRITANLPGFYLYSAHYPTILGVLDALQTDELREIPPYASALIFAVYYENSGVYTAESSTRFSLYFRSGEAPYNETLMTVKGCDQDPCPTSVLHSLVQDWSLESWCTDCNSYNNTAALPCILLQAQSCEAALAATDAAASSQDDHTVAVKVLASLLGVAVLVIAGLACHARNMKQSIKTMVLTQASNQKNEHVDIPVAEEILVASQDHETT